MLNWLNKLSFQMGFSDSGNYFNESLIIFYNYIWEFLIAIMFLIGYWMIFIFKNYNFKSLLLINIYNLNFLNFNYIKKSFSFLQINDVKDYPVLEGSWCSVPLFFVTGFSYPSIGLEYGISPDITPLVVVKVIAQQWYWTFEVETKCTPGLIEGGVDAWEKSSLYELYVDTYGDSQAFVEGMKTTRYQILKKKVDVTLINSNFTFFRLLNVNAKIVLPVNTPIKFLVTSSDVLHSFAIPALSLKIDAVPGRISEQIVVVERTGLFWGQCSELCGPYHGFMPVMIEVTSLEIFVNSFFKD